MGGHRGKRASRVAGRIIVIVTAGVTAGTGVVVAPQASELVYPIAMAVAANLTVDQVANAFTVYPSMTGSIAEAARRLHRR